MSSQADKGAALLAASKFDEAIAQYDEVIALNPAAPQYYLNRSIAHQRKSPADLVAALRDAEYAVVAATQRGRRQVIGQAQLRRAIVLFNAQRYGDAKLALDIAQELEPNDKTVGIWLAKIDIRMRELPEHDGSLVPRIDRLPACQLPAPRTAARLPAQEHATGGAKEKPVDVPAHAQHAPATASPATHGLLQPADGTYKSDWYQSTDKVYFNLLVKGLPKDQVTVDFQPESVLVSFPTGHGSSFSYALDPLFAPITPASSNYTVSASKIELVLKKSTAQKWSALESSASSASASTSSASASTAPAVSQSTKSQPQATKPADTVKASAPLYPSSSKSGPKNWDKLAANVDDDADPLDGEGDDVNRFFQTLYKGANDDTRRAMMKSFQESNGTVLSTNWDDVKKAKVETQPPDGMEAKEWNTS